VGEPVKEGTPRIRCGHPAELRLQALDFWLRKPDYLAGELLTKIEAGQLPETYLPMVEKLLESPRR
jgi:hypothetical protein